MVTVTDEEVIVGREALRLLGAALEPAWVLRTSAGPDFVVLEDGRSFAVPAMDELPNNPEAAAAIVELARQRQQPQASDVVGDLPDPINHQPSLPKGFANRIVDGPWEAYAIDGAWSAYEPNVKLFDREAFEERQDAEKRVNFLNMLASGEPIKAV